MQTARRLYVYLLSGIALAVLVTGVTMLLGVLFDRLGLRVASDLVLTGEDLIRQQLTLASALTVVSLPVWLVHWWAAERSVRPDRADAPTERSSELRGLYFTLVMGGLLLVTAMAASSLVETAVIAIAGGDSAGFRNPAADLAMTIVGGAAWAYHVGLRNRDWRRGPIHGAGAFLPRTYLYLATLVGLLVLLFGITSLLELIGRMLLEEPPGFVFGEQGPWWAFPLGSAVARVLVGGAIWLGHWAYANRVLADPGWRGASERRARVRLAFFVALIAISVTTVLGYVADGARNALATLLGVADASGAGQVAGSILVPLVSAVPFAIAWWLHVGWLRAESRGLGSPERIATAERLGSYAVALVGLAFAAVGAASLLALLIDALLGGTPVLSGADLDRRQLAQFAPITALGTVVWLWAWSRIRARFARDPAAEAASTTRRAALLIILAVSVLSTIASVGVVLYRLFGSLFGIDLVGSAVSELSGPIGVLLIAAVIASYHWAALRRDQSLRLSGDAAPGPATATSLGPVAVLRLSGPPQGDLQAALSTLRDQLPPGYALDVVTGGEH